jgi:transcriptional regulator with XRE-family HTH domain
MPGASTLLVPPRRFAELLVQRRAQMGRSLNAMESVAGGRFSAGDLMMFESGDTMPSDEQLRHLAGIYGIDLASISPQRSVLELDLNEGFVRIGTDNERFDPGQDDREILLRYLALVYRMREASTGTAIPPRNDDLATLAQIFSTTPSEMQVTLEGLMLSERPELRKRHHDLRRRVVIPGLGVLVALTTAGGLLLVRNANGPTGGTLAASPKSKAAVRVDIGNALVLSRGPRNTVGYSIGDALVVER